MSRKKHTPEADKSRAYSPAADNPPGSVGHAWLMVNQMKYVWQCRQLGLADWEALLADVDAQRIYDQVPPEKPYGSLEAMLLAEIGVCLAQARQTIAERAQALALDPEVKLLTVEQNHALIASRASEGGKAKAAAQNVEPETNEQQDDCRGSIRTTPDTTGIDSRPSRGTTAEYVINRIKRDAQDESAPNHEEAKVALKGLQTGEIKSAAEAGRRAMIVKPKPSNLEVAWKAVMKLTPEERLELLRRLQAEHETK